MNSDAEHHLKNFMAVADLQDELLDLDFSDEAKKKLFINKLLSSSLLDSEWTFRSVLVSIYTCYLCRPHSEFDYVNLFIEIAKSPKNNFKSDDYIFNFTNKFFILQLYNANVVNAKSLYDESLRSQNFFLYFYPEIVKNFPSSPSLKEIKFSTIKKHVEISNYKPQSESDDQYYLDKFIELRSKGKNPNLVALSIRSDDVERLQQLLAQTNTSFDSTIEKSIFERFIFINDSSITKNITLIEYAAFFGSIKCFKFLYQKYKQIPKTTGLFAVAGGNYDIVHLCEGQIFFDDQSLEISIRFFHPELSEYLEDNFNIKKTVDDVSRSLVFYNLHSLIDCESVIREDPNKPDSKGYNILSIASLNGDLDIIKYLILTFGSKIDINAKNKFNNSPLYVAAGNGHFEVVKYLCSLPEIDINAKNDEDHTALHFAAQNGYLNIVEFLCSLPNIDVNAKSISNFHPIDIAVKYNQIETINFLANLPDVIVYDNDKNTKTSILEYSIFSRRIDIVELVWDLVYKTLDKYGIKNKDEFIKTDNTFRNHLRTASLYSKLLNEKEIHQFFNSKIISENINH